MNDLNEYDIEDLEVGMTARYSKTITDADILQFAGASGDNNPIHLDESFAQSTPFKGRIVHGFLTASTISAAIAGRLPGPGTVYLSQSVRFLGPVRPGDRVDADVTVTRILKDRSRVELKTVCVVDGQIVVDGEATVKATSRQDRRVGQGRPR